MPFNIPLGEAAVQVVYRGVLIGVVGIFLFLEVIAHAGARRVGSMQALSPAFAVILGSLFLSETVPVAAVVAMVCIMAGIMAAAPPSVRVLK